MNFVSSTALVTGAGSGIGRALCEALAREGARVVVTDRVQDTADATAAAIRKAGGEAIAFSLDVCDSAQWQVVVAEAEKAFGPVDVLCSNAGAAGAGDELTELSPEFFSWLFNLNVVSAVRGIQAVVPGMKQRNRGRVLFTASVTSFVADVTNSDYSATKHALLCVADTLRRELAETDVQVGLLCPGPVMTNILENTASHAESNGIQLHARNFDDPRLHEISQQSGDPLTPEAVARTAIDGLRDGRFYIFTHPDKAGRISGRAREVEDALGAITTAHIAPAT